MRVIAGEPNIYIEEASVNGVVLGDEMDFGKTPSRWLVDSNLP